VDNPIPFQNFSIAALICMDFDFSNSESKRMSLPTRLADNPASHRIMCVPFQTCGTTSEAREIAIACKDTIVLCANGAGKDCAPSFICRQGIILQESHSLNDPGRGKMNSIITLPLNPIRPVFPMLVQQPHHKVFGRAKVCCAQLFERNPQIQQSAPGGHRQHASSSGYRKSLSYRYAKPSTVVHQY
jgi:hypothetical protein